MGRQSFKVGGVKSEGGIRGARGRRNMANADATVERGQREGGLDFFVQMALAHTKGEIAQVGKRRCKKKGAEEALGRPDAGDAYANGGKKFRYHMNFERCSAGETEVVRIKEKNVVESLAGKTL